MSCPNWSALSAHRNDRRATEPEGWAEALAHFDSCSVCRRQALAADPTLVFRRMPVVEPTPAQELDEVAAVRQAVAAMRTASRLDALDARPRSASIFFGSRRGWKRWAAAAVLALASLSLGRAPVAIPEPPALSGADQPLIEGLNLPGARVYQYGGEDVAVALVFSESLDV
ncbi:MAG TPA: hypothetical protein VLT87_12205 [Thermoanaerobaculia bacterium]|nr:hypothetical protein [Thermoanaerobaculia bacterium]